MKNLFLLATVIALFPATALAHSSSGLGGLAVLLALVFGVPALAGAVVFWIFALRKGRRALTTRDAFFSALFGLFALVTFIVAAACFGLGQFPVLKLEPSDTMALIFALSCIAIVAENLRVARLYRRVANSGGHGGGRTLSIVHFVLMALVLVLGTALTAHHLFVRDKVAALTLEWKLGEQRQVDVRYVRETSCPSGDWRSMVLKKHIRRSRWAVCRRGGAPSRSVEHRSCMRTIKLERRSCTEISKAEARARIVRGR